MTTLEYLTFLYGNETTAKAAYDATKLTATEDLVAMSNIIIEGDMPSDDEPVYTYIIDDDIYASAQSPDYIDNVSKNDLFRALIIYMALTQE